MRRRKIRDWIYFGAGGTQWFLGIGAAIFAGAAKVPEDAPVWPWIGQSVAWMKANSWYLVPVAVTLIGILQFSRRTVGTPWIWRAIHRAMDHLRDEVFSDLEEDTAEHHHRATLFRHVDGLRCLLYPRLWMRRMPWSGWLVPIERSGHLTRKTGEIFAAPDAGDRSSGIAGEAWGRKNLWIIQDLPEVHEGASLGDKEAYAKRCKVNVSWVHRRLSVRKGFARSYGAIRVEAKGRPWGVIVVDSRDPKGVREEFAKEFNLSAKVLQPLLERA